MIALVPLDPPSLPALAGQLDRLGVTCQITQTPEEARQAQGILLASALPFEASLRWLRATGWWRELPHLVSEGAFLVAMDAALHLLAEGTEEAPRESGLGLLPGLVRRLGPGVKVPHLGWGRTFQLQPHPAFPDPRGAWLYYGHGYAIDPGEGACWGARHGRPFASLVTRGRVAGVQARLGSSGAYGAVVLQALLAWMGIVPAAPSDFN